MKRSQESCLTPAALSALARGDRDNFLTAATPGGIEAQEKAGQTTFVANSQLPKDCPRKDLEKMGFKFGHGEVDGIFVSVTMPAGWTKRATDHSMWSHLIDDKGRKRASIFYKAAFYDRSAHMTLDRRYNVSGYIGCTDEAGTLADKDNHNPPYFAVAATDCDKEIHRVGIGRRDDYNGRDALNKQASAWLTENFPQWQDATAYWE